MNRDRIAGNLKLIKGMLREQWGRLTADHLNMIDGRREMLTGRIQRSYGIARDEAARHLRAWQRSAQGARVRSEERES